MYIVEQGFVTDRRCLQRTSNNPKEGEKIESVECVTKPRVARVNA